MPDGRHGGATAISDSRGVSVTGRCKRRFVDEAAALPAHPLARAAIVGGGYASGRVLCRGSQIATISVTVGLVSGTARVTTAGEVQTIALARHKRPRGGYVWVWAVDNGHSAAAVFLRGDGRWCDRRAAGLFYRSQSQVHRARRLARWASGNGVWDRTAARTTARP